MGLPWPVGRPPSLSHALFSVYIPSRYTSLCGGGERGDGWALMGMEEGVRLGDKRSISTWQGG